MFFGVTRNLNDAWLAQQLREVVNAFRHRDGLSSDFETLVDGLDVEQRH